MKIVNGITIVCNITTVEVTTNNITAGLRTVKVINAMIEMVTDLTMLIESGSCNYV